MTYEELKNQLENTANTSVEEKGEYVYVTFDKYIETETLLNTVKVIYDYEKELFKNKQKVNVIVHAKEFNIEKLEAWFKMALEDEDICDPVMCLNLFTLIKGYNTLSEKFFSSEDVYVNSIEQLLDIKLDLKTQLNRISKNLAIYFVSIIKYANKLNITLTDNPVKIKNIYHIFLCMGDILTLSGILNQCDDFKISDTVLIYDGMNYLMSILEKSSLGIKMLDKFLGDNNGDCTAK